MANTEVLFYVIVVVVIIVKLLFWMVYLYIRKKRARQRRQEAVETCYEELPAVPQPAYMFSGFSPEDLRHAVLIESLPGYQPDDPYKTDCPPPSYNAGECHSSGNTDPTDQRPSLDELVASMDVDDRTMLIPEDDDLVCLQQMT